MTRDKAIIKVMKIISDITDRQGIGNEFEMADDDIQEEMKETWIKILMED